MMIEVKDLCVKFDDNIIFQNLNFQVKKGEKLTIFGDSGAGKSTLLKVLAGFIPDFTSFNLTLMFEN
ncbi:ATP-binding cassette domain-containing protein [Flavobacteriaceae bacterium Ap0902]|nr:ATP-binding cassette domain-containing protein [Flavobacteriaceae bacterium Ap0902]